jgi:hypothetical protein
MFRRTLAFWMRDRERSARVAGAGARRVRRVALVAESLEDRQLLSILVTSHGGAPPVLANVQITSVYYGWNAADLKTLQTKLDDYLSDVSGSSYLGNLLEYGVGTGTLGPKDDVVAAPAGGFSVKTTIAATVPFAGSTSSIPANVTLNNFVADRNGNGITDPNNIQSTLNTEIKNGDLPAPVVGTSLYWVWLPPGVNVLFPDASGGPSTAMSNATFGGYHFFTNAGNPQGQYAYVVMPFPSAASTPGTVTAIKTWFAGLKANQVAPAFPTTYTAKSADAFNMLTAVGGHEMGEAVTDPYATGWYYTPMGTGGEIGDLLNGQNVWFTPAQAAATGNSYLVQLLWSNFIAQSNYPHAEPLVGGNPGLPGVVSSPNAVASRPPVQFAPNPPTSPPTRPKQPAPPSLPGPVTPPVSNPVIPGGGSVIQPVIVSSLYNPSDVALASQNGLQVSTNDGASWSTSIAFPASASSSGDSALTYDKNGQLYWANLSSTTRGISIVVVNPSTGATIAGPYSVDTPGAGFTDVQEFLTADQTSPGSASNNLVLVWTQLGPSGSSKVLISVSANEGKTWSSPTTVAASSGGSPPEYFYGVTASVARNGLIYAAYHAQPGYAVASDGGIVPDGMSGQTLVAVYQYNSGTHTLLQQGSTITAFSAGQSDITFNVQDGTRKIANTKFLTQGSVIPYVLADPAHPGTVYVITAEDPNAGTANPPSSEVEIATLTAGPGGTYSVTTSLVAPPASSSTFQLFPTATIDPYGDIVVSWYTNQNNQTNAAGDDLLDDYATYSTDGGQTWATPFQLDSQAFDPDAGAPDVLPGPPPTTGIGNSFGVAIAGGTAFVAHAANTFSGMTPTGQQVTVDSFDIAGTLVIPPALGNNVITVRLMSSGSDIDVVMLNGVTVFTGSLESIAGGILIPHDTDVDDITFPPGPAADIENDTLILDYTNGDPVPSGGVTFDAAEGGTNLVEVIGGAGYTNDVLSDSSLTVSNPVTSATDTIALDNVLQAQLNGAPGNDTFTLTGWSGTTTLSGSSGGTNTLVIAAGTVQTTSLSVSHVPTVQVTGGTLDVNASFSSIGTVQNESGGTLELDNGVTLTANVSNGGLLDLGGAVNTASAKIAGNLTQSSSGSLDIKLSGTTAGSQYDQLSVTGNVSLGGTLTVSLVNSFVPSAGNSFQIITFMGALTGDFTTKNFPTLGGGNHFQTSSGSGSYTLTVTT